jgi:hypothetical protein
LEERSVLMDAAFTGKVTSFRPNDKGADVEFTDAAAEDVRMLLDTFLREDGLKLDKGAPADGVYVSGSAIGRIAGGGFANRRKYNVTVRSIGDGSVQASIASAMTGMSGSVLGVMKERKQRRQLIEKLEAYLA